ncbi:hypothetical protein [Heyndrickxia sp. FSL W8-0423]|uniref:hypothetical protein n=1 Tax=Heyndrickxia sp. FSL W8-0423 TaxID=2921601 RepID=UPI0030FA30C1
MKPSLTIDVNSKIMSAKLKAIAKHTQALADELEQIDKSICPSCGELLDTNDFYADSKLIHTMKDCPSCGYSLRR